MSWQWENFTSPDFARAVKETQGVCIVPFGVIEKHSEHLPLCTDALNAHTICVQAAEIEPAIVFPNLYFGLTQETKNFPGAIALKQRVILDMLENICEEISRNGMKKIIILNGHGGNENLLPLFVWRQLEEKRDYSVSVIRIGEYYPAATEDPGWKAMMESPFDWHAGELETSVTLANAPDLVKMDQVVPGAVSQRRLAHLPKFLTSVWWYADFPDQYAGDAKAATAEKGKYAMSKFTERVASIIKAVKEDTTIAELEASYHAASEH